MKPPEIKILPDDVANKIAAGEVVERPASVVKELLENSIDAGATRIDIEFKHGGKTFIKVLDNGCGMTRQQALMSLEQHATSKIRSPEDLFSISSYGFRGEAVPSIASVSKFRMRTRPEGESVGTQIDSYASQVLSVKECGMPRGTEILVENLFSGVPARRKFLKSDNVEAGHIARLCRLYALALPNLSLTLVENSKVLFHSEEGFGVIARISKIFGRETAENLIELKESQKYGMKVSGAILVPGESFSTSRNICVFINGRPVECRAVYAAVKEAYSQFVPKGRFAGAFLFIELNPSSVDVNVHPAKREVRLKDELGVKNFIADAIIERLKSFSFQEPFGTFGRRAGDCAPSAEFSRALESFSGKNSPGQNNPKNAQEAHMGLAAKSSGGAGGAMCDLRGTPALSNNDGQKEQADFPDARIAGEKSFKVGENAKILKESAHDSGTEKIRGAEELRAFEVAAASPAPAIVPDTDKSRAFSGYSEDLQAAQSARAAAAKHAWRYVGCIARRFAIFETPKSMAIMSILSALRRVDFNRIMKALEGEKALSQKLLLPIIMEFGISDDEFFRANRALFESCGFEIDDFGKGYYRIAATPAWLEFFEAEKFVRDIVESSSESGLRTRSKRLGDEMFAYIAAGKIGIGGFVCTEESATSLLSNLLSCPMHMTSPDGRKTLYEISHSRLLSLFGENA